MTSADEFEMVVPFGVLLDIVGAERQPSGNYTFHPTTTLPKPFRLTLGDHDLGQWACDGAEIVSRSYDRPAEACVKLRRISD
jgi:hypothetical protein